MSEIISIIQELKDLEKEVFNNIWGTDLNFFQFKSTFAENDRQNRKRKTDGKESAAKKVRNVVKFFYNIPNFFIGSNLDWANTIGKNLGLQT